MMEPTGDAVKNAGPTWSKARFSALERQKNMLFSSKKTPVSNERTSRCVDTQSNCLFTTTQSSDMLIEARMTSRPIAIPLALLSIALGLAACGDEQLTRVLSCIEVDPPMIDFGEGIVDQENVSILTVKNCGEGNLEITSMTIMHEGAEVFAPGEYPKLIGPITKKEVPVLFVPRLAHEMYRGTLVIASNDPAKPEVSVPLSGVGGVREIEVFPESIDFGTVNEGSAPRRPIEIRNIGKDPLAISEVKIETTSIDMRLALGTFEQAVVLPGTSTIVEVEYSPVDLGSDSAVVVIRSNDEDEEFVRVPVTGNANLRPIAVAWGCDKPLAPGAAGCDGMEKVRSITAGFRRLIGLEGRDSYDPEGGSIMEYRWSVVTRPAESRAAVFHSTTDRTVHKYATGDIEIDRVGSYDLLLTVRDERGLESSATATTAHVKVDPRDLEISLRWDLATDVDLHVVQPGGAIGDYGSGTATSTGGDCSAFNRRPNWGDLSIRSDDPSLDKDDVSGRGPEIVSLDSPFDGGEYRAYAHYCDSRMRMISTGVVFEVYVRGVLAGTIPETGSYSLASGEAWQGARIIWNAQGPSVTILDDTMSTPVMMPELCLSR